MIASQLYVLNKLNAARKWKKGKISRFEFVPKCVTHRVVKSNGGNPSLSVSFGCNSFVNISHPQGKCRKAYHAKNADR